MPNYPTPYVSIVPYIKYPVDLNTTDGFWILLQLANYQRLSVASPPTLSLDTSIALPIPIKINDQTTITWEQSSIPQLGAAVGQSVAQLLSLAIPKLVSTVSGGISGIASLIGASSDLSGYLGGAVANPFLVMLFKNQNFKVHTLQWLFAPNSISDSENLHNIANILKNISLPTQTNDGLTMQYPGLVQPVLSVANQTYKFKMCAIESIDIDWSAGANPAFFGISQAPALVSFTITLKEVELWWRGQVN